MLWGIDWNNLKDTKQDNINSKFIRDIVSICLIYLCDNDDDESDDSYAQQGVKEHCGINTLILFSLREIIAF